jgi:hypothetical protein
MTPGPDWRESPMIVDRAVVSVSENPATNVSSRAEARDPLRMHMIRAIGRGSRAKARDDTMGAMGANRR